VTVGAEITRVLTALPRITREVESEGDGSPILVSGPPSVALELERLLTAGGEPRLVRRVSILDLEDPELAGSPVLVYVIKGNVTPTDERALRRADRQSIPMVCLRLGDAPGEPILPYVRATDVVRSAELEPEIIDEIARRIARRAPGAAPSLARRLPVLRHGVAEVEVERHARRVAVLGALSGRVPGPDFPAMAQLELRMGLGVAAAQGRDPRQVQAAVAAATLAGGFALRGLSRGLSARLPLPAWAIRAAVAYAGARLLGEAALALARRAPEGTDQAR
jgi:hypothetical protein